VDWNTKNWGVSGTIRIMLQTVTSDNGTPAR
jgi:hypothetical protein